MMTSNPIAERLTTIINDTNDLSQMNINNPDDNFDYEAGRAYLRHKRQALEAKRRELWQKAQVEADQIIQLLIERYAPQRIIQWGSLLEPRHFSEASDIDLAIEGVESILFLQLLGEAEKLTDFPLDLIRWEEIHPSFQKIILMKGKIIYVKDG